MKPIQITFSGESIAEITTLMQQYMIAQAPQRLAQSLEAQAPAVMAYVDEKIAEAKTEPKPEATGSCPKTYEEMRDAVKSIIGRNKEKLSAHNEILANFEVAKISDIDSSDYPMYWAEVQKL